MNVAGSFKARIVAGAVALERVNKIEAIVETDMLNLDLPYLRFQSLLQTPLRV